jgi:hypothetical protein
MTDQRQNRRLSGDSAPAATDEEDEIAKLQAERAAAAEAGTSKSGGEKYAGYAREISDDEDPEEDAPVRCVRSLHRADPISTNARSNDLNLHSSSSPRLAPRSGAKALRNRHFVSAAATPATVRSRSTAPVDDDRTSPRT